MMLIGVYAGTMLLPMLPANLMLSVWLQFEASMVPAEIPIEFQVLGPHDVRFFHATAVSRHQNPDPTYVTFSRIGAHVQLPGELKFQLKQHDDEWETIKSLRVARLAEHPVT